MKFGIFFEHQLPRPWDDETETRTFANVLEQCELADRIGIDTVWVVEHHFLEEYSHSSAPEVFLGAVAARTTRLRLGHGIVQLPPAINHPARVAERIATLDRISHGRVEFGTGEGSSAAELDGFGVDPEDKRAMWEEGVRVALRCMSEAPFTGHAGRFVTLPPRNVVPKPVQKPHPPVWVACTKRDTIHLAAQHGIGALTFAFFDPEEAQHWVSDYYTTLAEAVPIGDAVNANLACVSSFLCHPDAEEAVRRGSVGANFLGYSLGHYYVFGRHRPALTNVWDEFVQNRVEAGYDPEAVTAAARRGDRLSAQATKSGTRGLRGAVGTPDQVRDYLRRYEAFGVDQVILSSQSGNNRHEDVMESMDLFGQTVLPEFLERDQSAEAAKARRLEPIIEAALARKPSSDHPPLPEPDFAISAYPRAKADREQADGYHDWLDRYARDLATGEGDVAKRLRSAKVESAGGGRRDDE